MGPCNEKTLTGPACSVMKVLQSCEWIHTSFTLLSPCLSHRLHLIHLNQKRRCKRCIPDNSSQCQTFTCNDVVWIFNETATKVIYTHDLEPKKVQLNTQPPPSLCQCDSSLCCSRRWTMMYVLHFSFGWGHRLHKCLRQLWYFNLFLVGGCWASAQSIHGAILCQDISR